MIVPVGVFLALFVASIASAQPPAESRITVSAGLSWTAGYDIGDQTAALRSNATGSTPAPFPLFRTSSGFDAAAGFAAHVGFRLTRNVSIESGLLYASPNVMTRITSDAEGAPAISAAEQVQSFVADMGVIWRPSRQWGSRARPFLSGGFGLLRQLHEGRSLLESGRVYYAGAGAQLRLHGANGRGRPFGLRGEFRSTWRQGGIDVEDKVRVYPSLSIVSFVGF